MVTSRTQTPAGGNDHDATSPGIPGSEFFWRKPSPALTIRGQKRLRCSQRWVRGRGRSGFSSSPTSTAYPLGTYSETTRLARRTAHRFKGLEKLVPIKNPSTPQKPRRGRRGSHAIHVAELLLNGEHRRRRRKPANPLSQSRTRLPKRDIDIATVDAPDDGILTAFRCPFPHFKPRSRSDERRKFEPLRKAHSVGEGIPIFPVCDRAVAALSLSGVVLAARGLRHASCC